jgi:FdhD protein
MAAGFALLTARCSYELVEKAALAGIPMLVTISAPTGLAVKRAKEAGLTLIALARSDSMLAMSDPHGLFS